MRRSVWMMWSVLLAMSLAACKDKGGGQKTPEENKESVSPGGGAADADGLQRIDLRSERTKERERQMQRAMAGETVDFYGDGSEYRRWTDANGVEHVESKGPPHNPYRVTSEERPDGSRKSIYSAYGDDKIDHQTEWVPGRLVVLYDRDRDGFFEERLTEELNYEAETARHILEKRERGEERWTVIKDFVEPFSAGRGRPRSDFEEFKKKDAREQSAHPRVFESGWIAERATSVAQTEWEIGIGVVVIGNVHGEPFNGKRQCGPFETMKLARALEYVMNDSINCLRAVNPKIAEAIWEATMPDRQVRIDCELPDFSLYTAFSDDRRTPGWAQCRIGTPCRISFNKLDLQEWLNEKGIREMLLHELQHVAGIEIKSREDHDKNKDDEVYSCGRLCSGCDPSPQSNIDCARCARTRETKQLCGHKIVYGLGRPYNDLVCGCKRAYPLGNCYEYADSCTQNIVEQSLFCDGTIWNDGAGSLSVCCAECADALPDRPYRWWCEYTIKNWEEVRFLPIHDFCNKPPPFCP